MRNFDSWNRYLDNQGNPLHGCIQFMFNDGNTIASIYNIDGTPLSNPQITDIYGRTQHQVFIKEDVIAYFYKYIGHGIWTTEEDIDTSDTTKWSLQYTIGSQDTIDLSIVSDTNISVENITSLRGINIDLVPSIDGTKVITLLGYYNIGDKEPINYVWNESSTLDDNGGSVIQINNVLTGRWIMVQPTEHCDSRHFGVFPSNSYNMNDQTYGINKLVSYCDSKGIRPYFNGSGDYAWFKYSNISIVVNAIDVTDHTKFYDNGMNYIHAEINGNPYFFNHNTIVYSSVVDTKWNASSYPSATTVVFSQDTPNQRSYQGCVFIANTNVSGYSFNNCEIKSKGKLIGESNTFTNCKLTGDMFDADATLINKCTNCQIDLDDFKGKIDIYRQIRMTQDSNPNFDFKNIDTSERPIINYEGNKVVNGCIRIYNYNSSTSNPITIDKIQNSIIEIYNSTGVFNLNSYGYADTILIKDCKDISISNLSNGVTLMIENSSVGLPTKTITGLSVRNSEIYNGTITCQGFTALGSIISTAINCKDCVVKDSQINQPINQTINGITATFFDNDIFNAQLSISGASGSQVLSATITNNIGNTPTPIVLNRTYLNPTDASHAYTYKNNVGTFPKRSVKFTEAISVISDIQEFTGNEWFWTLAEGTQGVKMPYVAMPVYYYDDGQSYYRNHFKFSSQVSLFRVGTDDVPVTLEWSLYGTNNNSGYIIPNKFNAKLIHTNGESYRIESNWQGQAPSSAINGQAQVTALFNAYNNITALGNTTFNSTFRIDLD